MTSEKINWIHIHTQWNEHWRNRPDDYSLGEWLDEFWNARGGRDAYFYDTEDGTHQREHKEN